MGTLAAAAEELGVNASTVQRRIGKLEEELGARLFDRRQRGYSLTVAGERLLSHASAMEVEALALSRSIAGEDASLEGRIHLSTVDDLASGPLAPILRAFRQAHPLVEIVVSTDTGISDLSRRQADVAIRLGGRPKALDVVVKEVTQIELALYASKRYLRKHGTPKSFDDLGNHQILRGVRLLGHLFVETMLDRYADPAKTAMRTDNFLVRAAAIRQGMGVGFLTIFHGDADPALVRVPLDLPPSPVKMWMICHVDMRKNARIRAFVDFVFDALSNDKDRYRMARD